MCTYEKPDWPRYQDLSVSTQDLVTGKKIFQYEHSNLGDWDKTFLTKMFWFGITAAKIFALHVFTLQRYVNWLNK